MKGQISKLAFRLHSWVGLISGVFLLLLGLSGSMVVFFKEIDRGTNASLLKVKPGDRLFSLEQHYQAIRKQQPNLVGMAWLNPNDPPTVAREFRLYRNDGRWSTYDLAYMSIDPYTGRVLRQGSLSQPKGSLMQWLVQFHWSFQLGLPGLLLATVFALAMLLSLATGAIIYRKYFWKALTFRVRPDWANWRKASSGLHRLIGVWSLLFNVVICFTGFWMNKFSFDPAYWKAQSVAATTGAGSAFTADTLLSRARQAFPDLEVRRIYLPVQTGRMFKVSGVVAGQSDWFYLGNSVDVDPQSGAVAAVKRLHDQSLGLRIEATFFQIHAGHFGGVPVKVLYVLLGLTPGVLSVTGAMLWWRRRRRSPGKRL